MYSIYDEVMLSETEKPLVTVRISAYNHEKYVESAIMSIVNQTYGFRNIQLIVIDDCSQDKTGKIVQNMSKTYGFEFIQNEYNQGLAANINTAIKKARGKYLAGCASDDYWCLDKLEKQVELMESRADIPMSFGKAYFIDENDQLLEKLTKQKNAVLKGGMIFKDIINIDFHPPVNYIFRTSIFKEIGYYPENIWTEDFYINLKLSYKYEIGFIDSFISYYRVVNTKEKLNSFKITKSQKICIDLYSDTEYYREACNKWHFKNFSTYSSFAQHKFYSLRHLFHSLPFIFHKQFFISLMKLIIVWK